MLHEVAEYRAHLKAEGMDYLTSSDGEPPIKAYRMSDEIGVSPESHESFEEDYVRLFRGDSREVFEDIDEGEVLEREFPIYFTDNRRSAARYADKKIDNENPLLIEAEVPYDSIEILTGRTAEVEFEDVTLDPGTVYFLGSNYALEEDEKHLEFAATRIPKDWISVEPIN